MSVLSATPLWLKRLARRVLPAKTVEHAHDAASGGEYVPWMVSRENPVVRKFKRNVLGQKPHLHRLVVHLTDHCNLNCKGCTHFSNIAKPAFADVDQFAHEFARLSEIFSGINEIYLLGGEPLLHPRLNEFLPIARRAFPLSRINLMSNGLLVPKMDEQFWLTMADNDIWLVCDLYPVGLKIDEIEALAAKYHVHLEWTDPRGEFFKLPIDLTGSQEPTHAFQNCGGVNNCPILRDGKLYPCAYAAYSDLLMKRFDLTGLEPGEEDSISIEGEHSPNEIFDFLCNPVPWCRFCDVDHLETYQWARSDRSLAEWTAGASCAPREEHVG